MPQLRIGDIAKGSGLSVETIRYYERRGLISPLGRLPSGYRCYDEHTLERLHFVVRCKSLGFSLDEIQELLQLDPNAESAQVKQKVELRIAQIEEKITQLRELQLSLHQLSELCSGEGPVSDCPIIDTLRH
ncbi:heavy metal-responsive transcriptional regulator [Marinobacterium rhizophilum]|uniref:Heavy metal-responsive transcriptional regulator n=1 Tax=Marinobacterium rhizophilum TaxID=420402 RepID=A0ABY5HGL1_9GAMM|nr:heavy metal-responsive transcriptional regulator [Marinobacterium rhizophilum]UTW10976.1 heavy metal-responsive transcriptional regulator [Marinobacterium rhizophilum]